MLQKLRRIKNSRKGFTLIELIIVIAILGVLATILVPTMLGIVSDSQKAVNLANARSVYSVAQSIAVQWEVTDKTVSVTTSGTLSDFEKAIVENMGSNFNIRDYTITLQTVGDNVVVKSVEYKGETYPDDASSSTST